VAKYKLDQWKELINEWQTSGKTRQSFCREQDVTVATFSYWRTKINKLDAAEGEVQGQDSFVRYSLPAALTGGYIIEWPEGMKLRFPAGIRIDEIAALINALRRQR
jgi:hypothetical protein